MEKRNNPDFSKLEEIYKKCNHLQVSFSMYYYEYSNLFAFSIESSVVKENFETKDHSFDIACECINEYLDKLILSSKG